MAICSAYWRVYEADSVRAYNALRVFAWLRRLTIAELRPEHIDQAHFRTCLLGGRHRLLSLYPVGPANGIIAKCPDSAFDVPFADFSFVFER